MDKTPQAAKPQLAPNDPKRVPEEHRKFINEMFKVLVDANLNNFDAQIVSQVISHAANSDQFARVLELAYQIALKYPGTDKVLLTTDLQILGMKLNEAFNKMGLKEVPFEEI
ncbi:MAG TPA: hypothetical protein VFC63_19335 [Blastocatellia bacterium]|nr:hypothetical protein [Blastocatellia bacterium]